MPETNKDNLPDPHDVVVTGPRTLTVLVLMATAALIFSYLGAYKVSTALVNADLLSPWPLGNDPRPKWLVIGFLVVIVTFATAGAVMRFATCRSLRDIDEIANDD